MSWNRYSCDFELSNSSYAYIADNAALSITGDISGEAWIKLEQLPSTVGDEMQIFTKFNTTSDQRSYLFQVDNTDTLRFQASDDGTVDDTHFVIWESDNITFTAADVGVWRHVAFSFDISTETVLFYKDGVEDTGSAVFQTTIGATMYDGSSDFIIGCRETTGTGSEFFDGKMSNVRIWSDIRTEAEIQDNMYLTLTGTSNNLVGSWFSTANNYEDLAGTNDLTASGSPVFSTNVPWTGANETDWTQYAIETDNTKVSGSADHTDIPLLLSDANLSSAVYAGLNQATGGTITFDGKYTVHKFTSDGTFTVSGGLDVEYLVVAGGGAGNFGGGGAGGMRTGELTLSSGAKTVTIGAGGNQATSSNGDNSVFDSITSTGGGAGAGGTGIGATGGSGGGSANNGGAGGLGTAGQGNNGGSGDWGNPYTGGGGGGAGAVGQNGSTSSNNGGDGGAGAASSISGSSVYYAGGGGGTASGETGGTSGGIGGGGAGDSGATAGSGTANTGGGGGGNDGAGDPGSGGSGIVIVRYLTGSDLRLTTDSAGEVEVPFEIVALDTSAETAEIHLKYPTLEYDADSPLYIWYGNANAIAYDANAPFGSQAVWSDYKAVYHMQSLTADSTANAKTLTQNGTITTATAQIGTGASATYTDSTTYLINTNIGSAGAGDFTVSAWFKKTSAPTNDFSPTVLSWATSTGSESIYLVSTKTSGYLAGKIYLSGADVITSTTNISDNTWKYITFTRTGTTTQITIDGVSGATGTSSKSVTGTEVHIGNNGVASGYDAIGSAIVDEARYSTTYRNADWLTTEYNNQNSPSTFWSEVVLTTTSTTSSSSSSSTSTTSSSSSTSTTSSSSSSTSTTSSSTSTTSSSSSSSTSTTSSSSSTSTTSSSSSTSTTSSSSSTSTTSSSTSTTSSSTSTTSSSSSTSTTTTSSSSTSTTSSSSSTSTTSSSSSTSTTSSSSSTSTTSSSSSTSTTSSSSSTSTTSSSSSTSTTSSSSTSTTSSSSSTSTTSSSSSSSTSTTTTLPWDVYTYWFNASDAGPTDVNGDWTDDANAFDGNVNTSAGVTATGSNLNGTGTNSKTSGTSITQVRARMLTRETGFTAQWSDYITVTPPTGGWTWQKANDLECRLRLYAIAFTSAIADIYHSGESIGQISKDGYDNGFQINFHRIEIEISALASGTTTSTTTTSSSSTSTTSSSSSTSTTSSSSSTSTTSSSSSSSSSTSTTSSSSSSTSTTSSSSSSSTSTTSSSSSSSSSTSTTSSSSSSTSTTSSSSSSSTSTTVTIPLGFQIKEDNMGMEVS